MQLIQHCGVFNWRLWGFIKCVTMSWLFFEGQSNNRSMHVKSKPTLLDTGWKLLSWVTFRVQQRVIYLVVIKIRRSVRRISMNGLHREPRSCIKCIFSECGLYECWRFQVLWMLSLKILHWVFLSRVWNALGKQRLLIYFAHGCKRNINPIACFSACIHRPRSQ